MKRTTLKSKILGAAGLKSVRRERVGPQKIVMNHGVVSCGIMLKIKRYEKYVVLSCSK